MTWQRATEGAGSGVPVHTSSDAPAWRIVAEMSHSSVVGSRMVFGQWVYEGDHVSRPKSWRCERMDAERGRFIMVYQARTLSRAKQYIANRVAEAVR